MNSNVYYSVLYDHNLGKALSLPFKDCTFNLEIAGRQWRDGFWHLALNLKLIVSLLHLFESQVVHVPIFKLSLDCKVCGNTQMWARFIYLVVLGLSCGRQAPQLWHMGSLVVALTRDTAPQPGIEPGPPALGVQSSIHCATREVPCVPVFESVRLLGQCLLCLIHAYDLFNACMSFRSYFCCSLHVKVLGPCFPVEVFSQAVLKGTEVKQRIQRSELGLFIFVFRRKLLLF